MEIPEKKILSFELDFREHWYNRFIERLERFLDAF